MIYLYVATFLIILMFVIHYILHFAFTIKFSYEETVKFSWGTIFTFKRLYNSKEFKKVSGAFYQYDRVNKINCEGTFLFNNTYILFDPFSFVLVKLFCWHRWIREIIPISNLFKTYSRIEAEEVLDKLTQ